MSPRAMLAAAVLAMLAACGAGRPSTHPPAPDAPKHLHLSVAPFRLPAPIAREAVAGSGPVVTVAGGLLPGDGSSATAYLLDLRSGRTTALPELRVDVHDTAGALAGPTPLVIGGGNGAEQSVVQAWTGAAWSIVGHLPQPRSDLSAVSIGGRILVLGGYNGDGTAVAEPSIIASTDGRSWRSIGALPMPVRYAAAAVLDGTIWLLGGERAGVMQDAIQRVDPRTGRAATVAHLPQPIGHASAVVLGSRILLVGGRTRTTDISDRMWWFDPATLRVTDAGRLPAPLADSAVAEYDGRDYLIGGESPGNVDQVLIAEWR